MTIDTSDAVAVEPDRPRVRHDVVFLETQEGLFVRSLDGSFMIRGASAYQYVSALLPHLDGTTTVAELLDGLPEAHQKTITSLLSTLGSRGVITNGPGPVAAYDEEVRERYASQLALLDHHDDDGTGLARAMAARVGVVCDDPATADALIDALAANGVGQGTTGEVRRIGTDEFAPAGPDAAATATGDLDVICLLAPQRPRPDLFALADAARRAGAIVVVLQRIGDRLLLGPAHGGDDTVDIRSVVLRLSDNRIDGVTALLEATSTAATPSDRGPLPETAVAMAVSITAFEIFKITTGQAIPSDLADGVVVFDPMRLTVTQEPVVAHPASPHARPAVGRATSPAVSDVTAHAGDPGWVAEPPDDAEEAYRRFEPVVADHVGVFRRFDDDVLPQIPVKVARLEAPVLGAVPRVAFGTGTVLDARLDVLERAAAAYAVGVHRRARLLPRPGAQADRIDAERLDTWLGVPTAAPDVVAATQWATGAELAVPRAAVVAGPWDKNAAWFEPALVGVRAAPSIEEAAIRAVVDATGAAAVAAIARGEVELGAVAVEALGDVLPADRHQLLAMLIDEIRGGGAQVDLLAGAGIVPVAVVRVRDGAADRTVVRVGRSWDDAALEALVTLVGERQLADAGVEIPDSEPGGPDVRTAIVGRRAEGLPAAVSAADVAARLADRDLRMAVVDLTPPDLTGVTHVARALLVRSGAVGS